MLRPHSLVATTPPDLRRGHSFQIAGNDFNDLKCFSAVIRVVWQLRKPKKKKKKNSKPLSDNHYLTACCRSNGTQLYVCVCSLLTAMKALLFSAKQQVGDSERSGLKIPSPSLLCSKTRGAPTHDRPVLVYAPWLSVNLCQNKTQLICHKVSM